MDERDVHSLPFDTDKAVAELRAAGWVSDGFGTRWHDPQGAVWRGPAGAWRVMKRRQLEALENDGSAPDHPRPDGGYGYPR